MSALAIQKSAAMEPVEKKDAPAPKKEFHKQLQKAKKTDDAAPTPEGKAEAVKPEEMLQVAQLVVQVPALKVRAAAPQPAPVAPVAPATPATVDAPAIEPKDLPALTPLEQAVHDLIEKIVDDKPSAKDAPASELPTVIPFTDMDDVPPPAIHAKAATPHVAPMQEMADAEQIVQQAQSHVHLVFDDGEARIVMTVAVRGHDVHVATRTADDSVAATLARNANSLDHALRARGLDLSELSSQQDPKDRPRERNSHERRDQPARDQPAFSLEDHQ